MLARIRWLLHRLSVMSPSEMLSRLFDYLRLCWLFLEYRTYSLPKAVRRSTPKNYAFCRATDPVFDIDEYFDINGGDLLESESVRNCFLGGRWQWQDVGDIWHRASDTQKIWPNGFFALIDHRPGNSVGDVRVAWEPSRLQYLLHEALQYKTADSEEKQAEIAEGFSRQLHSWLVENPYLDGIHYISAMECGLRLMAACHCVDILRQDLSRETWQEFLVLVESHARLISRRLSLHSSAGNHTIAEAVSLLYVALLFPEMPESSKWRSTAVDIIDSEVSRQILSDGSGYEATTWYLLFIADLVALAVELANMHQLEFLPVVYDRLEKARIFISAMGANPENLIRIGDSDDGYALSPLLALNGREVDSIEEQRVNVFPDAGVTCVYLAAREDTKAQLYFLHTHAGMPPLYGHSHADCLSLLLNVNGQQVLVDPGTYTYNGDQQWRRFFKSTKAHNTLSIGGEDQMTQLSAFQWARPYRVYADKIQESDGMLMLSATHDGYRHKGVEHRRTLFIVDNRILVWDLVSGSGERDIAMNWHFNAEASDSGRELVFDVAGSKLFVFWPDQEFKSIHSVAELGNGWYSPSYGKKNHLYTAAMGARVALPTECITLIGIGLSASTLLNNERVLQAMAKQREIYGKGKN